MSITPQIAKSSVNLVKRGQMEGWVPTEVVAEALMSLGKVEIPETDEMAMSSDGFESDSELQHLLDRLTSNRQTADQGLLEAAGRILDNIHQSSDSKHVEEAAEGTKLTQEASIDTDSDDPEDASLKYPESSLAEYAYNWKHPPTSGVATVPRNTPEPTFGPVRSSYEPRVSVTASPAFTKLLKEKMRSVLLNQHLAQLEGDLDKARRTTQECSALIQDETELRANPRRMGQLFKLHDTRPVVRDSEEVVELVIGRITLEATICNDHGTVDGIDNDLRRAWDHFHNPLSNIAKGPTTRVLPCIPDLRVQQVAIVPIKIYFLRMRNGQWNAGRTGASPASSEAMLLRDPPHHKVFFNDAGTKPLSIYVHPSSGGAQRVFGLKDASKVDCLIVHTDIDRAKLLEQYSGLEDHLIITCDEIESEFYDRPIRVQIRPFTADDDRNLADYIARRCPDPDTGAEVATSYTVT
ncbi:uncharacterized protein EI90DRAFT_3017468 [Cantharellus anzutake]|uniref:uncharacterized protein n=1 Tax=Cantharellus anzutake TaxID=1750568 RepID=UPI0019038A70|nr:uncharacterized protein EI90DRAFT_3017468 [Cantharellus anzutake]KAF8328852.1 hypothetical protein EI90DRAFT_3017468 [Cantharellus anzutake]